MTLYQISAAEKKLNIEMPKAFSVKTTVSMWITPGPIVAGFITGKQDTRRAYLRDGVWSLYENGLFSGTEENTDGARRWCAGTVG